MKSELRVKGKRVNLLFYRMSNCVEFVLFSHFVLENEHENGNQWDHLEKMHLPLVAI